jgi:hypothetical protein
MTPRKKQEGQKPPEAEGAPLTFSNQHILQQATVHAAAKLLGIETVPAVRLSHLSHVRPSGPWTKNSECWLSLAAAVNRLALDSVARGGSLSAIGFHGPPAIAGDHMLVSAFWPFHFSM